MQARTGRTGAVRQAGAAPGEADDARRWVEAWADHVRKRFNSRAVVSARIAGAAPMVLSQVYALEGGGLVLVAPCDHPGDEAPRDHNAPHDHADDHAAHPHGEVEGCRGECEVWLASAAQVIFEARYAAEGVLCTGFGVLGLSRTPHVLVARGTEAPPRRGHEHRDF